MDTILNFAKDNYLVLLILGGVFLLSLIGYCYDKFQNKDIKIDDKNDSNDTVLTESSMEENNPQETVATPQPVQTQPQAPMEQSNEEEIPQINGLE